jgi:sugar/nucleoside kinase (ribokinase family)
LVARKNEVITVDVQLVDVTKIVDTNSAGDSFCGGFIAELLNGPDLVKCAKAGNYSAAQTIQHEVSKIPKYNPYKNW